MILAQDAPDYAMFETILLKVKSDKSEEFNAAMSHHNQTYHNAVPYRAPCWYIINGKKAGKIWWSMGPTTWTDLDGRPSEDGHDDDWVQNISPLLDYEGMVEYWKRDDDVSHWPSADLLLSKMRL